jgi:hypothetical protein
MGRLRLLYIASILMLGLVEEREDRLPHCVCFCVWFQFEAKLIILLHTRRLLGIAEEILKRFL